MGRRPGPWTAGLVVGIILLAGLTAHSLEPVAGQDEAPAQPQGPAPADAPGPLRCGASPYFALASQVPFAGEPVAWWAAGLASNSQASVAVFDTLNPIIVSRTAITVDSRCEAAGIITLPAAQQYRVELTGTSTGGDPVDLNFYPRAVAPPPVVPAPTPVPLPAPPSNLRATQLSKTTVRLDWADNSTNETGFVISTSTGEYQAPAGATTFSVGGLVPGHVQCFSLFAVNEAGRSLGGVDCLFIENTNP